MGGVTRREFIKTGAKGLALVSIPFIFKFNPLAAFAAVSPESASLSDYYNHFGVDETTIRKVMTAALERGGDYCDIYFDHTISNSMGLEDSAVNRAYSTIDYGVGIRVIEGEKTGYSFTEEITVEAMIKAARTAANIANESKNMPPVGLSEHQIPSYYPVKSLWEEVGIDKKIPYLQKVNEKILSRDSRIIKARVWLEDISKYILMATSEGRIVYDYQPMGELYVVCVAEQNGRKEDADYTISVRNGIEHFTDEAVDRLVNQAADLALRQFEAVKPEAGEMEVVLAAGSSGILLHEAIGHGMEADANRKGESIFSDKINKPVAEKFVSIVDSGTNMNMRGSINVDDEGNDTEETFLVENGILRSYLHDRISSKFYGVKPTGSGRRQSFRYSPIPRMRNTYMLPGPHTKEEIIGSVKKGIYTETFTNGEVRIGPGDFTFYVKSGYLIEDGKLTRPIKDINIIGNGPDVLTKVVMVGDDLEFTEGGWTCGKGGQGVPVSMGLPTVKVSSITVGGVSS
ncbi:MAG: peptidase U62 [candidate division Zixibacteria bacterium HGW-Zixibacteria-1]|nr:MAG: peptidase U62 [candidate division Zixibacteria bacterium HGW-Zixibacteria-1]